MLFTEEATTRKSKFTTANIAQKLNQSWDILFESRNQVQKTQKETHTMQVANKNGKMLKIASIRKPKSIPKSRIFKKNKNQFMSYKPL